MRKALDVSAPVPGELVALRGRLDVHTVGLARDELHAAVDAGSGTLVVDMSGVELLDATGLGMLVGTRRRADRLGRDLVLRGTPLRLRRLLRATRLERMLPTLDATPAAAGMLVPAPRRPLTSTCPRDAA